MKVLIIGGGGREHCLAWKISHSDSVSKIFAAPGNAGMDGIAVCVDTGISGKDFKAIAHLAEAEGIEMIVIGPEAPLVEGIADYLGSRGLVTFGPGSRAAMIEGSKVFTKELCENYGIPTAGAKIFGLTSYEQARTFIRSQSQFPVVIKADGLKSVILKDLQ